MLSIKKCKLSHFSPSAGDILPIYWHKKASRWLKSYYGYCPNGTWKDNLIIADELISLRHHARYIYEAVIASGQVVYPLKSN